MSEPTELEARILLEQYYATAQGLNITEARANEILQPYQYGRDLPEALELAHQALGLATRRNAAEEERKFRGQPQPGDLILLKIQGWVGWLVWLLQAINGDLSKWTHVAVMLDDDTVFEAQPGGAAITPWSEYKDRPHAVVKYCQVRANHGSVAHPWQLLPLGLTAAKRIDIVATARHFVDTQYNWATYFYLAAYRVGIRPRWLKDRVQRVDKLICSQAGDEIYSLNRIHLFADGRLPCDVTPGDLADLA